MESFIFFEVWTLEKLSQLFFKPQILAITGGDKPLNLLMQSSYLVQIAQWN